MVVGLRTVSSLEPKRTLVANTRAAHGRCLRRDTQRGLPHIKVHQDASNAAGGAEAQAIGKTKGGSNTKQADGLGRAVGLNLVPGNWHDLRAVETLLNAFTNCLVLAGRGFDATVFREKLISVGASACILPRQTNRIQYYYSKVAYAHRHFVETFFARIKRRRRISTRFEKLSETSLAFVTLFAVLDWLHFKV